VETEQLTALDRRFVWHPFTQQQEWESEPTLVIERAEGTTLYDSDGNGYIDGVSSLWCNVHGHGHHLIDTALRLQLEQLAHSTLLGLTHRPAIELARMLVEIAPSSSDVGAERLTRVFFSDNGSTAAEVALKMAFQWWQHRGERQRTSFVCLRDAYHGDTLGSVSVGGIDLFHSLYRPLLFDAWQAEPGDAPHMAKLLDQHGDRVAAVIVEPLVQGAAGMVLAPDGYLQQVRSLCDEHGIPLICDEVATGFGRTGRMFACQHEGVVPDFLCLSKGLTGGYLPLAATLTTERIYRAFLGEHAEFKTFFHGHTYTGNPLACAAALASLDVFERERTIDRMHVKIELLGRWLARRVEPLDGVAEVRRRGFMVGIKLADFPVERRMGHQVTLAARRRGAIIRPLGDVVVLMPPLAITEADLRRLVEITAEAIAEATTTTLSAAA
jgi:adenosylmethionine---8-amino-7-oxononanoate aminotransferase